MRSYIRSSIINWSFYSSSHYKITTEALFNEIEPRAERKVSLVIGRIRWDKITTDTYGYGELQDCIAEVCDGIHDEIYSAKGQGISSVSNDGYTETYDTKTYEALQADYVSKIRAMLSGTGLVGAY